MRHLYSLTFTLAFLSLRTKGTVYQWPQLSNDQSPITTGTDLGNYESCYCIGDISKCSNGTTISLWLKRKAYPNPKYNPSSPYEYIISSGGQSSTSTGFYLRENAGSELEIGVASGDDVWSKTFNISTGAWVFLAFTWNNRITIYVDGQSTAQSLNKPNKRTYNKAKYDPFPNIFVGQANDGSLPSFSNYEVFGVEFDDQVLPALQILSKLTNGKTKSGSPLTHLLRIGCTSADLGGSTEKNSNNVNDCKLTCRADTNVRVVAFNPVTSACTCSATASSVKPKSCTGVAEEMELYPASNYVEESHEIDFTIETKMATGKPYLRTKEAVTFTFKPTAGQRIDLSYNVDFGDGKTMTTRNDYIEHEYSTTGEFEVVVIANTRKASKETKTKVMVIDKDEGTGPEAVRLSASQTKTKEMTLQFCISAFGLQPLKCVLDFGDGTDAESFGATDTATPLFTKSFEHKYLLPGFYEIQLNCSNQYSFKLYNTVVAVRDTKYHKMIRSETSMLISVKTRNQNAIDILEGGKKLYYKNQTGMLSLGMTNFPSSQDYFVTVVSGKVTFLKYIVKRLRAIAGTSTTGKEFGQLTDTFDFVNQVMGDLVFGRTDYGGGRVVNYYMPHPKQPTEIRHAVKYDQLGFNLITNRLCNMLGCSDFRTSASVENLIRKVAMIASDINSPGKVKVTIRVNPTTSELVDRVKIELDPGYEIQDKKEKRKSDIRQGKQILFLENKHEKATDLYAYLQYEDFGMFKIEAVVSNNISTYSVSTYVQVGQNLSYIDIFVKNNGRQIAGGEVTIWLTLPTGSDPVYEIDFGEKDGKVLTIAEGPQQDTPPRVVMHAPGNVSVVHSYTRGEGEYTISAKVSNKFGSVSNSICPPVIIVSKPTDPNEAYCRAPKINFHGVSNKETVSIPMSQNITMTVDTTIDCATNKSATYTWKFYRIEKANGTAIERPMKTPCVTRHHNNTLVVKPLTLPYGFYKIEVCVGLAINEMKFSCGSFKIQINTSELLARIPELNFIQEKEPFHINITGSGDPDIKVSADDTSELNLICFRRDENNKPIPQNDLDEFMKKGKPRKYGPRIRLYDYMEHCFTEQMEFTLDGLVLTADSSFLSTNATYIVRLIVTKGARSRAIRDQTIKIIKKIFVEDMDIAELASLLDEIKDIGEKSAVISNMANQLNQQSSGDSDEHNEKNTEIRSTLVNAISNGANQTKSPGQLGMLTGALTTVTQNEGELDHQTKGKSGKTLITAAENGEMLKSADVSDDDVHNIALNILKTAGSILPKKTPSDDWAELRGKQQRRKRKKRSLSNRPEAPAVRPSNCMCTDDEYVLLEEEEKEVCWQMHPDDLKEVLAARKTVIDKEMTVLRESNNNVATDCQRALKRVGDVVGFRDPKDPVELESDSLKAVFGKPGSPGVGGFKVPKGKGDVQIQKTVAKKSPYFDSKNKGAKTGMLSVDFRSSGSELKMTDLSAEDSPLLVVPTNQNEPNVSMFALMTSITAPKTVNHNVNLAGPNKTIRVVFRPSSPQDFFRLCIVYEDYPNETNALYCDVLPKSLRETQLGKEMKDQSQDVEPSFVNEQMRYTFSPPADITNRNGTYRYSVNLTTYVFSVDASATNHTYTIQSYISDCRYWDIETNSWSVKGCKLLDETTWKHTVCRCNHLTSFGGDFVVPPNTIDFGSVFSKFKSLHENAAVFATVVTILCLYVFVLVWARRKDKKDVIKWGAHPLEDNLPSDTYHYQLAVHTGVRKGAGTKSRVSFILSGDESDTGVRELSDGQRKGFLRGSVMNFILSVEHCLGPLTFVRVWHDNQGKGKTRSWYLNQIQVTDLQTGDKYFFLNDRWLAVEEDDGMVERIIPVAGFSDMASFGHLFSSSVRKKLTNEHLWFSVVSRPTRSNFTRCQRVSCCLSLLFLTMITNCMFFKGEDRVERTSSVTLGPFSFSMAQLYISTVSTLIVFPVNLLMVVLFRKCKQKKNTVSQKNQSFTTKSKRQQWKAINPGSTLWTNAEKAKSEKFKDSLRKILFWKNTEDQQSKYSSDSETLTKKKKKQPFLFPHWFLYVAWTLCFLSVIGSAFFTILYSMEWGKQKAEEWLSTFVLSFFQSVIVVQPIKVLLLAAFISFILRKPELDDDEPGVEEMNNIPGPDEEAMRKSVVDLDKIILQRRNAAHNLRPPDQASLREAREMRLKEIAMESIIKEMMAYFVFIIIIFFLSYQTRSTHSYKLGKIVKDLFLDKFTPKVHENLFQYLNTTFISGLYAPIWYNGKITDWRERLCINDGNYQTIRVGAARLRQMRIKNNTCIVEDEMAAYIHHCRDSYNWVDDDTKPYYSGWVEPPEDNVTELEKQGSPWVYKSGIKLKNAPFMGQISVYKGGGYTRNLGRTAGQTQKIIQELHDQNWVDARTRAVFIEFTLYNGNVNLFASVIMVAEFMSTGGIQPTTEYKIFRLYSYVGGFGIVVLIAEIIFAIFVIYFFFRESNHIRKQRLKYFKDFWNLMEFSTLTGAVTCVAMYIMKKVLGSVAMDALKESGSSDFVNFQSIALWDELYGALQSTLIFIATIKFIKILKFNRRIGMLGSTLSQAGKDLKVFIIAFFIYFLAFCQFAYLLFGRTLSKYDNFIGAVEALFAFALGDFDFEELKSASPILGPIFFFLYVGIVYFVLMAIFLTIINDSFAAVKENTTLQSNDYELVNFMVKRFKGMFGITEKEKRSESQMTLKEEESDDEDEENQKKKRH